MASAGCAQLAGIDDTNNTGLTNTVELRRVSIGASVVDAPLVLTGLTADYLVPDGDGVTSVPATPDIETGIWSARLVEPVPVQLTLPDGPVPRWLGFSNRSLRVPFIVLEHPDPDPAPEGATINVTAPLPVDAPFNSALGESFSVYTVGSWTEVQLAAPVEAATAVTGAYLFADSFSAAGRKPLDRITTDDAFLVLRHVGQTLTGFATARLEQTGTDEVTTSTVETVVADKSLDVTIDPTELMSRYAAVRPMVGAPSMRWSLVAAPGYLYGLDIGPTLQSGSLTTSGVTTMYGNPFDAMFQWRTLFALRTQATRVFMPDGMTVLATLSADLNLFIEPPTASAPLDLPAGLPRQIKIDGLPLSADGQDFPKPTRPVTIEFTTENANGTLFEVEVVQLVEDSSGQVGPVIARHTVQYAASTERTVQVPAETFQVGLTYTIRVTCTAGGYPALETGDLAMRSLPLSQASLDSAVFKVTP